MGTLMKNTSQPTQRVTQLQNNAVIVETALGNILVNSPPEILKFLLVNGLSLPKFILLPPDIPMGQHLGSSGFVHQGINYASVEFLLYANYFINGGQCTEIITATKNQAKRIECILQETIIGPKDIEEYYPHPWVMGECRALSKNHLGDRPIELSDIVDIISLEEGGGCLSESVNIVHQDKKYIFFENGVEIASLTTYLDQSAFPLTLTPPQPVLRQDLTLQFLGGSNGYDPEGITTCFLAYFASSGRDKATLFDAAAYLKLRLGNIGISPNQISEVVISHLHEDHIAGLTELILGGGRVRIITSITIYRSMLRVLSAMLAVPQNEVAALFDFFPLQPKQPLILDGKVFEAIYAIHTIPTLAIRVNGLCYSGDMRYDEAWFEKLVKEGILSKHRRDELIQFSEGAHILVQDAGGGAIHTTPTPEVLSALAAKSRHVILTHIQRNDYQHGDPLASWNNVEFAKDGHVASFGETTLLDPNIEKFETISTCPLYARLSIANRLKLAENTQVINIDPGQSILTEGEPSNGRAYIVHKGLVRTSNNNRQVQLWGRGYSIGERGAITRNPRMMTVTAFGNTQLIVLDENIYHSVSQKLGLEKVYQRVEWLWSHPIFKHLAWSSLLDLALDFQPLILPVGRLLFEYGVPGHECYLLKSGEITLFNRELKPIGSFDTSGEFFGGRSILFGTPRNTYACVSKEAEIWALPAAALQRLHMLYPSIILHLRSVEMKRLGTRPFISILDNNETIGF
jgi:CRP-like cAMP-binding protein/ribonuclease BN (tRNA processing enzyme)